MEVEQSLRVQKEVEDVVIDVVRVTSGQKLEGLSEVELGILIGLQQTANEDEDASVGGRLRDDGLGSVGDNLELQVLLSRNNTVRASASASKGQK